MSKKRLKSFFHLDIQHFSSGDFEASDGYVSEGRVPEPGLLHVDGLKLEGVHDVEADEVQELNIVKVQLQILTVL